MTKYELYQILDENGFEPSEENLGILTECLDEGTMAIDEDGALYEFLGIGWKAAGKRYAKRGIKADKLEKKAATATGKEQKNLQAKAKELRDKNAKRDESMAGSAHVAKRMGEGIKEVSQNADKVKKARETTQQAAGILNSSYDLSQILDDNGLEVTNENLEILKEGLDDGLLIIDEDGALYEFLGMGWKAAGKRYAKRGIKADALEKKAAKATGAEQKNLQAKAQKLREKNAKRDETMSGSAHIAKRMGEGIKEVSKNADKVKKARETTQQAAGILNSSYDLTKLLEDNGFETTDENIAILKEDLEKGNTIILSAGEVALTESLGGDNDALTQILVENGFKVTENNLKVLAEAIENGHVLLEKKEIKDHKEHADEEDKKEEAKAEEEDKKEPENKKENKDKKEKAKA